MSARDVIVVYLPEALGKAWADQILYALTASGYRILGPDEVDPVTVEKCADVADEHGKAWGAAMSTPATAIATAIRALCATHHGDK